MTPEIRDKVIKMYQDGYSIKQIAKKTMYSTTNIYATLRLYNVAVLGKKRKDKEDV
ncbi:MAG: helix-turn-helix domain-containing protein [Erysipelotrichia bacterium]|nr:helix-turn-helix domain-containing protein [Erysipelotrichia bacterium]